MKPNHDKIRKAYQSACGQPYTREEKYFIRSAEGAMTMSEIKYFSGYKLGQRDKDRILKKIDKLCTSDDWTMDADECLDKIHALIEKELIARMGGSNESE